MASFIREHNLAISVLLFYYDLEATDSSKWFLFMIICKKKTEKKNVSTHTNTECSSKILNFLTISTEFHFPMLATLENRSHILQHLICYFGLSVQALTHCQLSTLLISTPDPGGCFHGESSLLVANVRFLSYLSQWVLMEQNH